MRVAYILSLSLLALGLALVTIFYRQTQISLPDSSPDVGLVDKLTDVQKLLLDSQQNMSKWLLGLAYGTLIALLGLRIRNRKDNRITGALPLCAASFLLIAIYAAFLFQDGIVFLLSKGPLYHLYGPILTFPLLVQFWCLVAALVLLAVWLYGPRKPAVALAVLALGCATMWPQTNHTNIGCFKQWRATRDAPEVTDAAAIELFKQLETKTGYKPSSKATCQYVYTTLDAVRTSWMTEGVLRMGQGSAPMSLSEYINDVNKSFPAPALSQSDIVTRLVEATELWRKDSGLLLVEAKHPNTVFINKSLVGVTTTMVRLAVGSYQLDIYDAKNVRIHASAVTVKTNATTRITVDSGQ